MKCRHSSVAMMLTTTIRLILTLLRKKNKGFTLPGEERGGIEKQKVGAHYPCALKEMVPQIVEQYCSIFCNSCHAMVN